MSTFPPIAGAKLKLGRAKDHLVELNDACEGFLDDVADIIIREVRANGREHVYIFQTPTAPPPKLGVILGDVVHNIRSALDHIVYAWACHDTPVMALDEKAARRLQFPICDCVESFTNHINGGGLRGIQDTTLIEALQFYNSQKWHLPALRELSNIDKHRHIAVISHVPSALRIGIPPDTGEYETRINENPLENGTEMFRVIFAVPQPDVYVQFQHVTGLAIEKVFQGKFFEVPSNLNDLIGYVEADLIRMLPGHLN